MSSSDEGRPMIFIASDSDSDDHSSDMDSVTMLKWDTSDDFGDLDSSRDEEMEREAALRWNKRCEYNEIANECTHVPKDFSNALSNKGLLEDQEDSPFCRKNEKNVEMFEKARMFTPYNEDPEDGPYYSRDVDFPFRKLGSELWEVPPYVPLFVMHPYRMHQQEMENAKNNEMWRKALVDVTEDSVEFYIECIQRHTSSLFWSQLFTAPDRLPGALRAILDDMEYRRFFAMGKYTLLTSWRVHEEGRHESNWFYNTRFGVDRSAQDWDAISATHDLTAFDAYNILLENRNAVWPVSLVNREIHSRIRNRYSEFCCYTRYMGGEVNYNQLGPDGTNGRVTREANETIECIRLIQKQFHPKLSQNSNNYALAWDSKRFAYHATNGLCFWPNVTWGGVFRPVNAIPENYDPEKQTILMKAMVMEVLMYEGFNRSSLRSLVQWENFNVHEFVPHMFWWENVDKILVHALEKVFYVGEDSCWKQRLLAFFDTDCWEMIQLSPNYKELEKCVVRSIEDHAEYRINFQCEHCREAVVNQSFVMMHVDQVLENVSICDALMFAKDHGFGLFDYCLDPPEDGDHNVEGHVPNGERCCAVHCSIQLQQIVYNTRDYVRCCWDCAKEKKRYLFLGKAHLDRGADIIRQHTGAWWLDVERATKLLGFKHNAKKAAKF